MFYPLFACVTAQLGRYEKRILPPPCPHCYGELSNILTPRYESRMNTWSSDVLSLESGQVPLLSVFACTFMGLMANS